MWSVMAKVANVAANAVFTVSLSRVALRGSKHLRLRE